jgi:hypothetical protein
MAGRTVQRYHLIFFKCGKPWSPVPLTNAYSIADDKCEILQKTCKYYELQRITYSEILVNEPRQRSMF